MTFNSNFEASIRSILSKRRDPKRIVAQLALHLPSVVERDQKVKSLLKQLKNLKKRFFFSPKTSIQIHLLGATYSTMSIPMLQLYLKKWWKWYQNEVTWKTNIILDPLWNLNIVRGKIEYSSCNRRRQKACFKEGLLYQISKWSNMR